MKKFISVVLCLFFCVCLVSCDSKKNYAATNESYDKGLAQGKEDFFMTIWNAAYDLNSKDCGELWETDDFSIKVTTIRKTEIQSEPNARYLEIDFTLNEGTIERYWKSGNLRFYIYSVCSVCDNGMTEVGTSDWFIDYFDLGGSLNGNKGYTDIIGIHEDTESLKIVIVVDDRIYATSYDVDI